jgi:hypothetical protein
MKDIFDSIRLQIYERLSSPLFGSFVAAWVGWNYRFLFVMFSGLPVDKKFEFVDSRLYVTGWDIWSRGIIEPTLTAILFIYLYPIISRHFYGYWLKKNVELKKLRDDIENTALLTREESYAMRMEMIKAGEKYEETIRRQAAEIEALKKSSTRAESSQLREKASQLDKIKDDNNKLLLKANDIVVQGTSILSMAQRLQSSMQGVELAEVSSWVTRLGELILKIYGEKSQRYADYSKALATQNFYNIHSNWNAHIAQMLGVAKSITYDLEKDAKTNN